MVKEREFLWKISVYLLLNVLIIIHPTLKLSLRNLPRNFKVLLLPGFGQGICTHGNIRNSKGFSGASI